MKILLHLFWILIVLPSVVQAGNPDFALNEAMDRAGFSNVQSERVQSIIETASQQGLPSEALAGKVYEGVAKNIDPDRIITALERVTSRYEYGYGLAQKMTHSRDKAVELGNTVTAGIAAGLTRQDAEKIVSSLQARSRQMDSTEDVYRLAEQTMLTARDMSRQGVSSSTTAEVIGKAVEKGYATAEMQTLRHTFNRQAAHANREALARDYGTAIDRGIEAHELTSRQSVKRRSGAEGGGSSEISSGSGNSGGDSGSSDAGSSGSSDSSGSSGGGADSSGTGGDAGSSGSSGSSGGGGNSDAGGNSGDSGSSGGSGGGNGGRR